VNRDTAIGDGTAIANQVRKINCHLRDRPGRVVAEHEYPIRDRLLGDRFCRLRLGEDFWLSVA